MTNITDIVTVQDQDGYLEGVQAAQRDHAEGRDYNLNQDGSPWSFGYADGWQVAVS